VSSSDGQHFPTGWPGKAVGAVNAHYGREVSALFYTHLSARQVPYHTVAIPPSGEAAYVIDGLLYHEADLSIATHHTDGGGVSDHTFALAHVLGFRSPRASPTWPTAGSTPSGRPALGQCSRLSSPAASTKS
jgi:TnpA family transposase